MTLKESNFVLVQQYRVCALSHGFLKVQNYLFTRHQTFRNKMGAMTVSFFAFVFVCDSKLFICRMRALFTWTLQHCGFLPKQEAEGLQ